MIRKCIHGDVPNMFSIINSSARAYEGIIPPDCYHQPYMPLEELQNETARIDFFGWEENTRLLGVMGIEAIKGVKLIRHAYVLPESQGKGIGSLLLKYLLETHCDTRILVGTWADAAWAIKFYEHHGFQLAANKNALLKRYWDIPHVQIENSVVLEYSK